MMKRSLWTAAAVVAIGCGGGTSQLHSAFTTDWQDDGGAGVRAVSPKILATPAATGTAAAVGVTPGGLVGVALSGGTPWFFAHPIDARPTVTGTVVVGMGAGELFALDASTGRALWTRKTPGNLRGAGDDGRTTVVSLGTVGDNGSIVLAIDHEGTVVRQLEAAPQVGVPAVLGNYAFLPWSGQYVTIFGLSSGAEEARILVREQVSRAFTYRGKVYFGELGLFRFDEQVSRASTHHASHVSLPARELPGDPKWFRPATERRAPLADAYDKIALFGAPAEGTPFSLDSSKFASTYYKIVVGFDAKTGAIAWAKKHAIEIVAGSPFAGGVALCDTDGNVTLISVATGATLSVASLGRKITSCAVEAESLHPPPDVASAKAGPLVDQIAGAIDVAENEMIAMHKVLLRELGKLDDPKATKALLDLSSDPRSPPALAADIETALATRRTGGQYMIDALARHYDFLKDVLRPPP
ncbi:MAG TPA: PQQ-binding-like beta-propeller repeat protein, partial [Polyangiaceae bacterium]|nr:PQQ-binding-like beta-propeller repeat protein [Polyangiaceae bacterium]